MLLWPELIPIFIWIKTLTRPWDYCWTRQRTADGGLRQHPSIPEFVFPGKGSRNRQWWSPGINSRHLAADGRKNWPRGRAVEIRAWVAVALDLSRRCSRAESLRVFSPRKSRASPPAPAQFTRPFWPRQASPLTGSLATWPAPEKHPCAGTWSALGGGGVHEDWGLQDSLRTSLRWGASGTWGTETFLMPGRP